MCVQTCTLKWVYLALPDRCVNRPFIRQKKKLEFYIGKKLVLKNENKTKILNIWINKNIKYIL